MTVGIVPCIIYIMLEGMLGIANAILAVMAGVFARQLWRARQQFTPRKNTLKRGFETDLPSVTVCVPARNEQHALTDCLQRIIASSYERLEIIVLDDVSVDNTSALIKSFASEGVRFVKGEALPSGWLGKNHALQGLLKEASGSYILFVDVDTALAPNAIENMVHYALSTRASMVSVLPCREDGWRMSIFLSPLRYFWEVVFHRRFWPATSSNAWLIRREVLKTRFNGFISLKNTAQPEAKIAAELAELNEYRFLMSNEWFGVGYEKKWSSQLATSVRLMYPLLGKRVSTSVIVLLDLLLMLVPFAVVVWHLISPLPIWTVAIQVVLCAAFCLLYGMYARRVWRRGWFIGALLWPLIVLQEAVLVLVSILQHLRRGVTWKGRTIRPEAQN